MPVNKTPAELATILEALGCAPWGPFVMAVYLWLYWRSCDRPWLVGYACEACYTKRENAPGHARIELDNLGHRECRRGEMPPYPTDLLHLAYSYPAIASISMRASRGRRATCTVDRAGYGAEKYVA
jgi:hypothetical protein